MKHFEVIIFSRPLIKGKVKTRLAVDIGNEKAFTIYQKLFDQTIRSVEKSGFPYKIYYSSDHASNRRPSAIQHGYDLGERMSNAFQEELKDHDAICIIGCDCFELKDQHLHAAVQLLKKNDVVLGPAKDGGYYLIGMKIHLAFLFNDISWGSDHVLNETLQRCKANDVTVELLPTLNDIDRAEDIPPKLQVK